MRGAPASRNIWCFGEWKGEPPLNFLKTKRTIRFRIGQRGYPHQLPRFEWELLGRGEKRCDVASSVMILCMGPPSASTSGAEYGSGRLKGRCQIPIWWLTPTVGAWVGHSRHR